MAALPLFYCVCWTPAIIGLCMRLSNVRSLPHRVHSSSCLYGERSRRGACVRQARAAEDSAIDIAVAAITSVPSSCGQLLSLILFEPLRRAVLDDAHYLLAWVRHLLRRRRAVEPEPTGAGAPEPPLGRRPSIPQDHTVPQLVIREAQLRAEARASRAGWKAGVGSLRPSLSLPPMNWGSSRRAGGATPAGLRSSVTPADC